MNRKHLPLLKAYGRRWMRLLWLYPEWHLAKIAKDAKDAKDAKKEKINHRG